MFAVFKKICSFLKKTEFPGASFVVCGIGNKGNKYNGTRHNIGFDVVDACVVKCELTYRGRNENSFLYAGKFSGEENVLMVKPQTYVNRSGTAVKELMNSFDISLSSFLIVVDDFHLPVGTLRFRKKGSDGGHNGLRSIIDEVGKEFPRLRVGIGPLPQSTKVIDFVLGKFNKDEVDDKNKTIQKAVEAVGYFFTNGMTAAMNKYNNKN